PMMMMFDNQATLAHVSGLVFITVVWITCAHARLSMNMLAVVDAASLLGTCLAWALFVNPALTGSVFGGVASVTLTVLARAITVPSKAGRTLVLTAIASVPLVVTTWMWQRGLADRGVLEFDYQPVVNTAVYQLLLVIVAVAMATVTSRVIYDLR